jgi:hypothetical protein
LVKNPEKEGSNVAVSDITSLSVHTNPVADQTAPTKLSDVEALKVTQNPQIHPLWP